MEQNIIFIDEETLLKEELAEGDTYEPEDQ